MVSGGFPSFQAFGVSHSGVGAVGGGNLTTWNKAAWRSASSLIFL
ncbi:hypothetical protein DESME_10825 [Desulfitobacterium metallireducens DSM 15288]|uniref:Uncharacterized protein n=1 Tax=Desulfitobacterium metallireducens DSM 15288 TaxID=871968 RepID=W0EGJ1_9FIRM|nr:hypothetical protein DESME_10825 [Desulfitobacterium metallireducens DSM 15288]